jgi:hypothetical protein
LTCRELSKIVGVRVEPHIVRISRKSGFVRQKFDGEYVYFYHENEKVYRSQVAKRRRVSLRAGGGPESTLNSEVEELRRDLQIALALLNYPRKSPVSIIEQLRQQEVRVTLQDLHSFLIRYDIKKKDDRHEAIKLELLGAAAKVQSELLAREFHRESCWIVLDPPITHCPHCSHPLYTLKTTTPRKIRSIFFGEFWIKERLKSCRACGEPKVWRSEIPKLLAPPKRTLAYDVMVFVGEQKFLFSKTLGAIRETLAEEYGLAVSPSLLSLYAQEFCYRFECLHYAKLAKLAEWMKGEQLGYMLHVDCSSEHKSDTIFVAYDRTSEIVLVSEKIPSERLPFLVPVLQKVKEYMGIPVSSMSDMGLPIIKAIEEVFPDVQRRICHFHFLRDIGKDLIDPSYAALRTRLNQSKINAKLNALERDILCAHSAPDISSFRGEGPLLRHCSRKRYIELEPVLVLHFIRSCRKVKSTTGFGYPFDLPRVRYAEELCRQAIEVQNCLCVLQERRIRPELLKKLAEILSPILPQGQMYKEIQPLMHQCTIRERQFAELRQVMRLFSRPKKNRAPLSALYGVSSRKEILTYNKSLRRYRKELRVKLSRKGQKFRKEGFQIILTHIEKYWGNLLLHSSLWRALQCQVVDRTNNLPESGFRNTKQSVRKTTGRRRIEREFSDYGPYLPVISNLKNTKYVHRVLGEYKNLPLEFALLNPNEVACHQEKFFEAKNGSLFRVVRDISNMPFI